VRVVVVGAGVGGLAVAVRLAHAGHRVTVLEQAPAPGGKCGRVERAGFRFDSGPSLLTMPWVLDDLLAATGAPAQDELEMVRVEPVTRYGFADGSGFDLSADLPAANAALEAWSPGAGADWTSFLGACARMWRSSVPFLTGPPPWPPRRPGPGAPPPDPRDLVRVQPWRTLRGLARAHARDPRLRMVIERSATYAGADPRRAPAALAVAGYVEHAFGAWHVRGGLHEIVRALVRRLERLGGELRTGVRAEGVRTSGGRARGVETSAGALAADTVVWNGDEHALRGLPGGAEALGRARGAAGRSLSGYVLMLGLRGRTPGLSHHTILFPERYDPEFDDVFVHRRPVRDPTLYVSVSSLTEPSEAAADGENWFLLVNAPLHEPGSGLDWDAEAGAYEEHLLDRLAARGLDVRGRVVARARRTPADLERETGAPGGAIYGRAPHGRLGTLRRPGNTTRVRGLHLVGGTAHPGGGLPLVMLSAEIVARAVGRA
jgi:phytoene desaturase